MGFNINWKLICVCYFLFTFQKLLKHEGIKVGAFMGKHTPAGGLASVDIAVCVIEKANRLINRWGGLLITASAFNNIRMDVWFCRLLEEGTLGQVGIVVVDELHQLGDHSRGYLLELLITKLIYMNRKYVLNLYGTYISRTVYNFFFLSIFDTFLLLPEKF